MRPQTTGPSPLDDAHPFNGYFLKHPHQPRWRAAGHDPHGEGLVSTISHDPPVLNWVYVDPETHHIKYGTRPQVDEAQGVAGPWDVTAGIGTDKGTGLLGGGRRLMFEGWEGFVAVEEMVELQDDGPNEGNAAATQHTQEERNNAGVQSNKSQDVDQKQHGRRRDEDTHNNDSGEEEEEEEEADDQSDLWASAEEQLQYTTKPTTAKLWGLYVDRNDDGLSSGNRIGKEYWKHDMLEVELTRRERRRTRETAIEERADRLRQRKKVDEKNESRKSEMAAPQEPKTVVEEITAHTQSSAGAEEGKTQSVDSAKDTSSST